MCAGDTGLPFEPGRSSKSEGAPSKKQLSLWSPTSPLVLPNTSLPPLSLHSYLSCIQYLSCFLSWDHQRQYALSTQTGERGLERVLCSTYTILQVLKALFCVAEGDQHLVLAWKGLEKVSIELELV